MAKFSWITMDLMDAAVITTNSEAAAGPVTNLKEDQPSDLWVADNAVSGIIVDVDFGAVVQFNWISLMYHNGLQAGTIALSSADTQGGLGTPFTTHSLWASSGLEKIPRRHSFWSGTTRNNRWLRLAINDPTNPASAFQAGRLCVGLSDSFSKNHDQGGALTPMRRVQDTETAEGAQYPSLYPTTLEGYFDFNYMNPSDYAAEWDMVAAYAGKPLLMVLNTDETDLYRHMIYGDWRPEGKVSKPWFQLYRFDIAVKEWA